MLNYEGTKTPDGTHPLYDEFQYSKNYEGTKTSKVLYHFLRNDVKIQF